jgi:hypothetical protein
MSRCLMRGANQACADGPYSKRRHSLVCTPCDLYKLRANASTLDIDSSSEPLFRVVSCNCAHVQCCSFRQRNRLVGILCCPLGSCYIAPRGGPAILLPLVVSPSGSERRWEFGVVTDHVGEDDGITIQDERTISNSTFKSQRSDKLRHVTVDACGETSALRNLPLKASG